MSGFVFYRGASLIDGAPIVGVAIVGSKNSKTGNVVQTYIIRDDVSPLEASKSGQDASICGNCKHRGTATNDPKAKQQTNGRNIMSKYQGHKNWNHWNVSLWINNDEKLYRAALESIYIANNKEEAVQLMYDYVTNHEFMGMTHTPDGAPYSISSIRAAMVGM